MPLLLATSWGPAKPTGVLRLKPSDPQHRSYRARISHPLQAIYHYPGLAVAAATNDRRTCPLPRSWSAATSFIRADPLLAGGRTKVGVPIASATARRAALDATPSSWTLERWGRQLGLVDGASVMDLRELTGGGPACAGRAAQRQSPALTPGQRRRRRRLDHYYCSIRQCVTSILGRAGLGFAWCRAVHPRNSRSRWWAVGKM
jgi:hypothetical protein